MMAQIHLIRHGRSAHVHDGRWLTASGVREFENAYNLAGIGDDRPPADVIELAVRADVLVASDMRRAIESARALAPLREPSVQPLLREIELEPPRWLVLPLPMGGWDALSHMQWSYRLRARAENDFVRRAAAAVGWLAEQAKDAGTIAVVTHGGFRRLLAAGLAGTGWRAGERRNGYENWSVWSFSKLARMGEGGSQAG